MKEKIREYLLFFIIYYYKNIFQIMNSVRTSWNSTDYINFYAIQGNQNYSNLMILDEPFRGLDQDLKVRIVDRLWEKMVSGKTVIVITHSREDIELLGINELIYVE